MATSKSDGAGLERERIAASVVLPCIGITPQQRVLVCHDDYEFVSKSLISTGHTVHSWWRMATDSHTATPWPEPGPFDAGVLRLSKDKGAFEMALHATRSVLLPNAPLWVYGANDEGIKSATKIMQRVLTDVQTIDTRKHCRVVVGTTPDGTADVKGTLDAWSTSAELQHPEGSVTHTVFPGIFAKGSLDAATELLLKTMDAPQPGHRILDYACGAGVIGGWMARKEPSVAITQVDADAIAAVAAQRNLPNARTVVGASISVLEPDETFDIIASNPPIHIGKSRDYGVLRHFIVASKARLNPRGTMWLVVQRQADIAALLGRTFRSSGIAAEDSRFRVWKAY